MMFENRVWGMTRGPEKVQGARDGENGTSHQTRGLSENKTKMDRKYSTQGRHKKE
jgi:hypothetical protein